MSTFRTVIMAVILAGPVFTVGAHADGYAVTVIGDKDHFTGCLASNDAEGVGFLAVGDKVEMFANSAKFDIAKGASVSGTWAVDDATPVSFTSSADSANTATIDVPTSAEAVMALTSGKQLNVTANGAVVKLSLSGSDQAWVGLSTCMTTQKAP